MIRTFTLLLFMAIMTGNTYSQILCDGGTVTDSFGRDTAIACVDSNTAIVAFDSSNVIGAGFEFVIADQNDTIMGIPLTGNNFDFATSNQFEHRIYGVAFEGDLVVDPGSHITSVTATECVDISSNFLVVYRMVAPNCSPQVGIDDIQTPDINIYPVPASKLINVELDDASQVEFITLTDVSGKLVSTEQGMATYTFDVSKVRRGIYLLRVVTDKGVIIRRVMIE